MDSLMMGKAAALQGRHGLRRGDADLLVRVVCGLEHRRQGGCDGPLRDELRLLADWLGLERVLLSRRGGLVQLLR